MLGVYTKWALSLANISQFFQELGCRYLSNLHVLQLRDRQELQVQLVNFARQGMLDIQPHQKPLLACPKPGVYRGQVWFWVSIFQFCMGLDCMFLNILHVQEQTSIQVLPIQSEKEQSLQELMHICLHQMHP